MGHERIGTLPKMRRWRDLVEALGEPSFSHEDTGKIASQTLQNVSNQYRRVMFDNGVKAAFRFLIAISVSSRRNDPKKWLAESGIRVDGDPTPLALTKAAHTFIRAHQESPEYARIAQFAAGDAIVHWHRSQSPPQATLFDLPDDPFDIWKKASNGSGFCELSRLFFAKYTERYLNYFLEREASASIASIKQRDEFMHSLDEFMDEISRHAFETSKITQSFAAGWYNKNVDNDIPSDQKVDGFLRLAFEKIREELYREADSD